MKILYLHQYFVTPDSSGGTRSYEFARRLREAGHEVLMITSSALLPQRYQKFKATKKVEIDGISVVIINVPYSNHMSF